MTFSAGFVRIANDQNRLAHYDPEQSNALAIKILGLTLMYKIFYLFLMIICIPIDAIAKDANSFLGTWKLVSVTRDTVPPSKAENSFCGSL